MRVKSEKGKVKSYFIVLWIATMMVFFPIATFAATADLSITQAQITFSKSEFYVGDVVRIYAKVKNLGETDMIATVFFYQSSTLIGSAQPISLPASGAQEEVFVDFTIPNGSFNIRAVIQGADPADENPANDEATTPLYTPIADADRDDVADDEDNCTSSANADQADTDGDGTGDACDSDDDNDGLSDARESSAGTNPTNFDTDGDGTGDGSDSAPLSAPAPSVSDTPATASSSSTSSATSATANDIADTPTTSAEDAADETDTLFTRPTSAIANFFFGDDANDEDDAVQEESRGFFRFDNPLLVGLVGFLIVALFGSVMLFVVTRRKGKGERV